MSLQIVDCRYSSGSWLPTTLPDRWRSSASVGHWIKCQCCFISTPDTRLFISARTSETWGSLRKTWGRAAYLDLSPFSHRCLHENVSHDHCRPVAGLLKFFRKDCGQNKGLSGRQRAGTMKLGTTRAIYATSVKTLNNPISGR